MADAATETPAAPPPAEAPPAAADSKQEPEAKRSPPPEAAAEPEAKRARRDDNHGGSRRPHRTKHANKFDPSQQAKTDDPGEIRKQVEFYFSDANLVRDKFLFDKVGGAANNPVPVRLLHNFKRMRRFEPFDAVVAALKDSDLLDVVDGKDAVEGPLVVRKAPLGIEGDRDEGQRAYEKDALQRTVYVKGFGAEGASTQTDLETFLGGWGDVRQVRLRRHPDGMFKGSVFVEMGSEEEAKKVLDQGKVEHDGNELVVKSKEGYLEEKKGRERKGGRSHDLKTKRWERGGFSRGGGRRNGGGREGRRDRDEKKDGGENEGGEKKDGGDEKKAEGETAEAKAE